MTFDAQVVLTIIGQMVAIVAAIIVTYVKTAVRLKEIELKVDIAERISANNHTDLKSLRADFHLLSVKLEHIETMQAMLCANCPMRPGNNTSRKEIK